MNMIGETKTIKIPFFLIFYFFYFIYDFIYTICATINMDFFCNFGNFLSLIIIFIGSY